MGTRVPTPQAPIQAAITLLGVRKTLSADVTAQWSGGKSTPKRCYLWSRKQRWEVETVCFSCHITTCREHSTYSAYSVSVAFCCFLLFQVKASHIVRHKSDSFLLGASLHQGCPLSKILVIIFMDRIFRCRLKIWRCQIWGSQNLISAFCSLYWDGVWNKN